MTATEDCRGKRVPVSTYRWQFSSQFTLHTAVAVAEYLHELGISDVYASPLLQAGPGSTHGYDTCQFERLNQELGGGPAFEALVERLRQLEMGLLLDFVPNHMGTDLSNPWWRDVLEQGRASRYASWFDIDWQPPTLGLHERVLLPILEDHYAKVLEAGKLQVAFEAGGFHLTHYERKLPLSPPSCLQLFEAILGPGNREEKRAAELQRRVRLSKDQAGEGWTVRDAVEFSELRNEFDRIHTASEQVRQATAEVLRRLNGRPGDARSFDALDALLRKQHYRLCFWRLGPEFINYRRFFDITELVALRMESPEVFAAAHALVCDLVDRGKVSGLRIDHPDGLWDPKEYFQRLAARCPGLYVVAEKILSEGESLPEDWPVDGTTGYDFLNRVNGVFVDGSKRLAFDSLYREFTGLHESFGSLRFHCKREVLRGSFSAELDALTRRLEAIAAATRYGQDFTFRRLREALVTWIAAFPVYRTYISERSGSPSNEDRTSLEAALKTSIKEDPQQDPAVLSFVHDLLQLRPPFDLDARSLQSCRAFVMKFQQLTAPVMAKGVEDTAFYRYNALLSLNEVGGEPGRFGLEITEFHEQNQRQGQKWPHSLLATATHDTKRGEDVRARLDVLSEIPQEWAQAIKRWSQFNAKWRMEVEGQPAPSANDEYLLYQTLVGAWDLEIEKPQAWREFRERITAYLIKATREAKLRTSWTENNPRYEQACVDFVEKLLDPERADGFVEDFLLFQNRVAFFGRFNSLAQTLLKLTAPGVPDIYQGTELWDFSLVDPDNRRPVDYGVRQSWLAELKQQWRDLGPGLAGAEGFFKSLIEDRQSGRSKLFLIWRTLQFRRAQRELFARGAYLALASRGSKREHVCAFARECGRQVALTLVPRLVLSLMTGTRGAPLGEAIWGDTSLVLPPTLSRPVFENVLTGETVAVDQGEIPLSRAFARFPLALLKAR